MKFNIIIIGLDNKTIHAIKDTKFHHILSGCSFEEALNFLKASETPKEDIVIIDCGIKLKPNDPAGSVNHGLSLVLANVCAEFKVDMIIVGINNLQNDLVSKTLREQMKIIDAHKKFVVLHNR